MPTLTPVILLAWRIDTEHKGPSPVFSVILLAWRIDTEHKGPSPVFTRAGVIHLLFSLWDGEPSPVP